MPNTDQLIAINKDINNNKTYRMNALKNIAIPSRYSFNSLPKNILGYITLNNVNRYIYEYPRTSSTKLHSITFSNNKLAYVANQQYTKFSVPAIKRSYKKNKLIYELQGSNGYGCEDIETGEKFQYSYYELDENIFKESDSVMRDILIYYKKYADQPAASDTYIANIVFTKENATWYRHDNDITSEITKSVPFYAWCTDRDNDTLWFAVHIATYHDTNIEGWIKTDNSNDKLHLTLSLDAKYATAATAGQTPPADGAQNDELKKLNQQPTASVDDDSLWIAQNFDNPNFSDVEKYYTELYGNNPTWSMKSFKSVIGLPFHFMHNVDQLVGTASYGKQFIEDILYDMPIVCLRPGGPVMNSSISGSSDDENNLLSKAAKIATFYNQYIKDKDSFKKFMFGDDTEFGGTDEGIIEALVRKIFVGKYARFYTFSSDFQKYVEYVNTLCHVFIEFLDIGNIEYTRADGVVSKYSKYQDTWEEMEDDQGNTMKLVNGPNMAIYGYYQPESQIGETFSNSTTTSSLAETMKSASSSMRQTTFMLGIGGINNMSDTSAFQKLSAGISDLTSMTSGGGIVGRLFSTVGEGVGTVIGGNNIDLPEIYDDSSASGGEETLIFKLVSPYGDRESIFLYILRPLARLMAMSLPRQFGPNSYRSPFLVQAFSKGHFNIQCGIVTNLSIRRGGNGGESHTINNIPTELEVSMTIKDMYGLVTLSNEYLGASGFLSSLNPFGAARASRLLFNNIGLIDFCASYCGYNLNAPEQDTAMTLLMSMWSNRISDSLESPLTGYHHFKSPKWNRELSDAFYDAVTRLFTFING